MTVERHAIPPGMRLHPLRAQDLTASDIGAAVGVDPYRSPLTVYAEKTGQLAAATETPIMRRGRWLEAAAVEALNEEYPTWDIRRAKIYLREPELRLGATPDVLAEDPDDPGLVNIQLKAVSRPVFERDWADAPPLAYVLQTLAEGFLLDARKSLLAALVIDTYSADLEIRDVPRHAGAEARICDIAREFWQNIAAGRRPAPDYSRDAETIRAIYQHADAGKTVDLSGDNRLADLLVERADFKSIITRTEQMVNAIDAEIQDKLGANEIATLPGWRLTWREEHRKAYMVAASTRRVLRVKQLEQQEKAA